ncbi:MAG TPA: zinc ABC transporter substrate-binding protein [Sulfuricaulis sp.]|nr:zinc ABC transporter substrate-binding protein [Sulfuricaulis sp.]
MKGFLVFLPMLFSLATVPAHAELKVFACEPEWAALAQELGGEKVSVFTATTARQDPHRIEARPSLIARLRQADLLVCTGADLEAGWLPVLLRQAGNARVQPGRPGYFEAAQHVQMLEIPARLDRAEGDVHAAGNPHLHTDPRRIGRIAGPLAERMARIDPANAAHYRERHARFAERWERALADWTRRAAPLRGMRVVTQHRDWIYLHDWLGLEDAGVLEPKPGLPATAGHLSALSAELARRPARAVIRTPYQDPRPSAWLAQRTGVRQVVLPYTIGGSERARDLFGLFDDTLERLLELLE